MNASASSLPPVQRVPEDKREALGTVELTDDEKLHFRTLLNDQVYTDQATLQVHPIKWRIDWELVGNELEMPILLPEDPAQWYPVLGRFVESGIGISLLLEIFRSTSNKYSWPRWLERELRDSHRRRRFEELADREQPRCKIKGHRRKQYNLSLFSVVDLSTFNTDIGTQGRSSIATNATAIDPSIDPSIDAEVDSRNAPRTSVSGPSLSGGQTTAYSSEIASPSLNLAPPEISSNRMSLGHILNDPRE